MKNLLVLASALLISVCSHANPNDAQFLPKSKAFLLSLEALTNLGEGGFGLGFELGSMHLQRLGWTFGMKFKAAGAEASNVSYQTAKNYFGDSEKGTKYGLTGFYLGRTYAFNEYVAVSASAGFDSYEKFVEFYDPTGILGKGGQYYVKKEKSTSLAGNVKLYLTVPNTNFHLSAGHQTGIVGTYFGLGWMF